MHNVGHYAQALICKTIPEITFPRVTILSLISRKWMETHLTNRPKLQNLVAEAKLLQSVRSITRRRLTAQDSPVYILVGPWPNPRKVHEIEIWWEICLPTRSQFCTSWWRHQIETFSALLAIYTGNSPVPGEFPIQRPVTRSFDVLFDLHLNKRLSKQWLGWWFETQSHPLWRHRNDVRTTQLSWHQQYCDLFGSL